VVGNGSVHIVALSSAPEIARADNNGYLCAVFRAYLDFFADLARIVKIYAVSLTVGKRLTAEFYQDSFVPVLSHFVLRMTCRSFRRCAVSFAAIIILYI